MASPIRAGEDSARAYVPNFVSNDVSVIDTGTGSVIATIAVGNEPRAVAVNADWAYIPNRSSGSVSVISTSTNTVVDTIPVGSQPRGAAIGDSHAYVSNSGHDTVSVIDTATRAVVKTISVGDNPRGVAMTDTHAYVINRSDDSMSVIDLATQAVVATVAIGTGPRGIGVNSTRAYSANFDSNDVSVVDLASNMVIDTIAVGSMPVGVAATDTRVYVTNGVGHSLSIIDAATNSVIETLAVSASPNGVAISDDGTRVFVASSGTSSVDVIDTATRQIVDNITVGTGPSSLGDFLGPGPILTQQADLSLSKQGPAQAVAPGDLVGYSLIVSNLGPSDSTGGQVVDSLPADLDFDSSPDGCSADGQEVTCAFGALAASESLTLDFVARVAMDPGSDTLTNTATVSGNETDPVSANDTDSADATVDATPPMVGLASADPGGALSPCTQLSQRPGQIRVVFDEPVADPAGHTDPGDVSNPASYLLVRAGADRGLSTFGCASGVGGDDVPIPLDAVVYDETTRTATLDRVLEDDVYSLFVCGSIADEVGNPLDGNGDGTGGDDFFVGFRIAARNVLANGDFDCGLQSWSFSDEIEASFGSVDFQDSPISGSLHASSSDFIASQCTELSAAPLAIELSLQLETAPAEVEAGAFCALYDAPDCSGNVLSLLDVASTLDTVGIWSTLRSPDYESVPGTSSVQCSFELSSTQPFDVSLDHLYLVLDPPMHEDGFETGDTTEWSTQCPPDCNPLPSAGKGEAAEVRPPR